MMNIRSKHTEETTAVTGKKLTQDYFTGDFNNKIRGDTLLVLICNLIIWFIMIDNIIPAIITGISNSGTLPNPVLPPVLLRIRNYVSAFVTIY